ncbi:hypothetical protein K503DRAFT_624041 [Rhizopogon vinicolor AM-OR11-026]|uniref:Uncharacterized protein n=1 Tax=Rhizopogon vinicolor AM-OR11-026 TaxID=1314800 RepID=A0A1B7N655_9AGAM|nr:hypothetical protein K503DRAFT_624041 [Rhizopogon vinicolor AM-OR11-026]
MRCPSTRSPEYHEKQTATTSNSSRRIAAFGLLTPLASPDSQLKLYPSDFQFTSAPHAPPPLRDNPKDIKPLTFAPKHSEHSFDFRCIPAPHAPPSLRDIPKDTKSLTFAPKPSECSFDFRCIPAPHAPPPFRDIPKDTEPLTFAPKLSERSFDFRCIPAPHAPPPLRDIPKDTKPLTFAPKPSEDSKKESAPTLPPLTGLLTLDSTPPRNLRLITGLPTPDTPPRSPRPICPEVKSESSPSPDTTSNVALAELSRSPCQKQCTKLLQNELAVTTEHEYVLCAGRREQQCSGITSGSEKQCQISVYHPDRYCRHHVDQDTGSKSYEQSIEGSSITSPHPAGLPTPDSTPPPDSKVVCWETGVKSESSPSPEAISSVAEIAKT